MATAKKLGFFSQFSVILIFPNSIQSPRFLQVTTNFELVSMYTSSRHSNSNFAHQFVIHYSKMVRKRINTRIRTKEKSYKL